MSNWGSASCLVVLVSLTLSACAYSGPDPNAAPQPDAYLSAVDNIAAHLDGVPDSREDRLAFADQVCRIYAAPGYQKRIDELLVNSEARQFMAGAAVEKMCPKAWAKITVKE